MATTRTNIDLEDFRIIIKDNQLVLVYQPNRKTQHIICGLDEGYDDNLAHILNTITTYKGNQK